MSKIGMLRDALLELLHEHERDDAIPTSGRFLFYELVQRGIISKEQTGKRRPDQDMSQALTILRERGDIPWDWIVDETRSIDDFTGSRTVKEWMLSVLPRAQLDPWAGEPPMILTESRSLRGVLRDLCLQFRVPIAATNGQCGGFLHTEVAPRLRSGQRVLYLGDFDLSGNMIEENTSRVLVLEVGALDWERLALTQTQVTQYNLPTIVKHDRRFKDGAPHEAVETEALSQRVIVDILRTRLEELLPEPLEHVHVPEEEQRAVVEAAMVNL